MSERTQIPPGASADPIASEINRVRKQKSNWLRLDGRNLTEVPAEVLDLVSLRGIDLSQNLLKTIPNWLWELPQLQNVNLIGNPIETLPDRPGLTIDVPMFRRLSHKLNIKNIHLVIGVQISKGDAAFILRQLKLDGAPMSVTIGKWAITIGEAHAKPSGPVKKILNSIGDIKGLKSLSIRGLALGMIPEGVRALRALKHLSVDAIALKEFPDWIASMELETFSSVDNKVAQLPDSYGRLVGLKHLSLSWNPLKQIPECLFRLRSLETLTLNDCRISEIPADVLRLESLRELRCRNNPIESPPREVVQKGLHAIRDYWRQREDAGVDYLCEAKLIILGEPGAGKTSLARKIEDPNYQLDESEKSTEGIDVIRHQFPTALRIREGGKEQTLTRQFQVNIWDFGGQEIYHATHQFFLTRRSVYVLVCDDRKEDTDFSYWLHAVEMLSDGSPLIIVQNEKQDRSRDINLPGLRARFANLRGALSTNLDTNRGLAAVVKAIEHELATLPHVGVGLPATWKRVREALEQDTRDYISLEEYFGICQDRGFTRREDKLQLSGYLHDLGICLHFQADALLKNFVILKPSWGTDAVYRVLDDAEVISARGQFTRSQLGRIWSEEKYSGMHDELLRLMMKFQLCYALESEGAYIAPQLLSSEVPAYSWEARGGLVVRYEYEFLPKGILTRFIVALHRLIGKGKLVWKTGVVLERDGARAEVIEEYSQRRIRVRVRGPQAHGLLAIVEEQLERLHGGFPRLKYERFLPCPCSECSKQAEPYGFALQTLFKMATKGQEIQCHASGKMVDAGRLVRDFMPVALQVEDSLEPAGVGGSALKVMAPAATPEVFVSYAWNNESAAIVDRLQQSLGQQGIRLIRDREEVRYKDSIRDFMRRIGQGKCVVVIISEKYLKSENCMFEMVEVAKAQGLRERIFPIVLSDAKIYKATGRIRYVQHWESEIRELDEGLKTVRGDNLLKLQEDLNIYAEIRRLFDGIADTLRDMNALTPDHHEDSDFEELIARIRVQLV